MSAALSQPTPSPSFVRAENSLKSSRLCFGPCSCASRDLLAKAAEHQIWPRVSLRHLNRWRAQRQMSRCKGRARDSSALSVSLSRALVGVNPRLSFLGVHLFTDWIDQQHASSGERASKGHRRLSAHAPRR